MASNERPTLPAIVTSSDSNSNQHNMGHTADAPVTPPRAPAAAHSRSGSSQMTPPVLFVTPSGDDRQHDTTQSHLHGSPAGGNTGSGLGLGPPLSAVNSSDGHSQFPPSPTLTNNSAPSPHGLSPQRDTSRGRGHSPTKSVDSAFFSYIDAQKRRPSGASMSTFNAMDGPRAADQLKNPSGEEKVDLESGTGAGAGGKKVREGKPQGFLGKIPLLKRFAKKGEPEDVEEDDEKAAKQGKVVAVLPDPSPEEMGKFGSLVPSSLNHLIDPKSIPHLEELGGDAGLLEKLYTDPNKGLNEAGATAGTAIEDRKRVYGENRLPQRKSKSLLQLMWIAFQDKILILLSVAAVISLALGIYQDVGQPPETYESPECPGGVCEIASLDWVEGVAIVVAIVIVVMVGSVNDYQKEIQFRKLNAKKEARNVKCIRDGSERLMSVYDVVVGDICVLEPGEIVPVDGVFLSGHNVKCDESSATGESDAMKKAPYQECLEEAKNREEGKHVKTDPFLLSGSKVLEGSGKYVVTAVGQHSFLGKIMMSLQGGAEATPLQLKLNRLAEIIAKLGATAGLVLFASLMIRFFTQLDDGLTADQKGQNFIKILIIAVTIVVVAVPEGLPLAVTLALAFATRRMTKQNLLVRVLGSCETMGTATVICTDKTGTLTQNKMSVVAGSIGVHLKFAERLEETKRTNANSESTAQLNTPPKDFSIDATEMTTRLSLPLQNLLNESITINSTAFEGKDEHGNVGFVGSKTETALLTFAQDRGWENWKQVRERQQIVEMVPFSSERKAMGVVVKTETGYRLFLKGASEVLFKLCTNHVVVSEDAGQNDPLTTAPFDENTTRNIDRTIIFYANQSLRTIALCYRDFESWPPAQPVDGSIPYESMARDLTLLGITAIEDPLREGVTEAVRTAQAAGVAVKMCTGDNVLTARSIATQCGIFTPGGVIMEGPTFRQLSRKELLEIVPRLQVLARSSPTDKKLLVDTLKSMGEVVGVTGDGANDAPALKSANVGFAMGIAGTEVAKEASDIILMDDNFASIVTAISWGRCVNDSVKKFLQFQISVNITAVILTYITAVASAEEESVLTAVQLLWVNLIMDTFAALALATDPAGPENLRRKPDRKMAPLISADMWKMIVGQSIFQLIVALVLHFAGAKILGYNATDTYQRIKQEDDLKTLVFNTFVFCQIFNMLNSRELGRRLNIFTGIWKNYYFLGIFAIMVGGQVLIVNVGGAAFQVSRIGGNLWGISVVIGLLSLPVAVLIRLIPTGPIERAMIKTKLLPDPNALPVSQPELDEKDEEKWDAPFEQLKDNLKLYGNIRGGRLRASSFVKRSRSRRLEKAEVFPTTLMAMVPSMVLAMPAGGFRPDDGSLLNPAAMEPSRSSTALYRGAAGLHPDTDRSDPLAQKYLMPDTPAHSRSHSRAPSVPSIREDLPATNEKP